MSVNSLENKRMIWDILEPTLPENMPVRQQIKAFIDEKTLDLHRNRFKYQNNIMEINKILLSEARMYLIQCNAQAVNNIKKNEIISTSVKTPAAALDRNYEKFTTKKEHAVTFEKRLRDQQENFNQLIDKKKPKEINFADKIDEPISTITSLMDSKLQAREKELSLITEKYNTNEADKWLTNKDRSSNSETQTNIKIQNEITSILKPIEIKSSDVSVPKTVTFSVDKKDESSSFLNRLKQRSNNSDRELLQQIIENQKKLMEQQQQILTYLNKSNT